MAAIVSFSEEDLLCPQCTGVYCVPVRLNCGHNICKVCLNKFWEWKGCRECPVCGTESTSGRPPINLQLKIAADEYQVLNPGRNQEVCSLHNEKLQVFCNNDEEPICLVCQISKQHKIHVCSAAEDAAKEKKKEICGMLENLKKKLGTLTTTKQQWEETKTYIGTQSSECESEIKKEFMKLHEFLWEEEKNRLKTLKQEEETKVKVMCKKIENIKEQIRTLSFIIRDGETALTASKISFLQNYKQTRKMVKCSINDPECVRDILINSADHLGCLKFNILKKMTNIVEYAPVTLDPNTAHSNLMFSQELTCVQYSSKQLLPDNPERFINRLCVLGATGFTSGKHSWTVELGQGKEWCVGVAQESIKRKGAIFLSPAEGFWGIGSRGGSTLWAQTSPPTKLIMKQKPEMITTELDYDKGKVVFINAAESSVIHVFKYRFTERIFPYFSTGPCEDWKNSSPLTISPLRINVNVE